MSFDAEVWAYNRQAKYNAREAELIQIAAMAPHSQRKPARLNLARFYLARGMSAEAKGVLDVVRADAKGDDDVTGTVLESVANLMLHRPEEALKELSNARIGNQLDAPIWRAIAYADLGKWPAAQAAFKNVDNAIAALPVELQRLALRKALRTAIEVRDFNGADRILNEITTLGIPIEHAARAQRAGRPPEGGDGPQRRRARQLSCRGAVVRPAGRRARAPARDPAALYDRRHDGQGSHRRRWKRSPRSGAATTSKPKASSCSRIFIPSTTAIAPPST